MDDFAQIESHSGSILSAQDGLRRARAQAQRELNDQADRFEDVIAEIQTEMRGVRGEGNASIMVVPHDDAGQWCHLSAQTGI